MKPQRVAALLGIVLLISLVVATWLGLMLSGSDASEPYMPAGAALDSRTLLGTWYDAPCGDDSITFAADGTFQTSEAGILALAGSHTYHLVDGHHLEIDGLQYNAALSSEGHLAMFQWPREVRLQRDHISCLPTPADTGDHATETPEWPAPLPCPVPTAPPGQ